MRRGSGVKIGILLSVVLAVSSCGGDDDSSNDGDGTVADAVETGDDGANDDGGEAAGGDDLVAGMMAAFVGEDMVEILTEEERDCMNDFLAPSFPQGLPPGLAATEEFGGVLDALNTAAEACDVTL